MSMSDDQEKCAICKYHGCCPTDANGFTPCEREYEDWADDEEKSRGRKLFCCEDSFTRGYF